MDRNEAIKVIKNNWPEGRHQLSEALKTLIPEFQESEDEKWRNWLIGHLKGYINQTNDKYAEVCKKAIAWLEKQGEQKSTTGMSYREIFPKFSVGDTLCRQGWANHTVKGVYVDSINTVYICKNEEGLKSHIDFSEQDEWNKIEQISAGWSEEDEPIFNEFVAFLEKGEYRLQHDLTMYAHWLKSIKERMKGE